MESYDLCIVGAGMIGAAAARHASAIPGVRVCLIGVAEPEGRSSDDGRDIYGAHYDEGRITRRCDGDPVWARLAQSSIQRYREIERKSGIIFYSETGNLFVSSGSDVFNKVQTNAQQHNVNHDKLDGHDLKKRFAYMKFPDTDRAIYEAKDAGTLNPRELVKAQKIIAQQQGCTVIDDVVEKVERIVEDGTYVMRITTEKGKRVKSRKVLLATGAFTTFRNLLPGVQPDQQLCPLTVALVELDTGDARKLSNMPGMIYMGTGRSDWHQEFPKTEDGGVSYYMLPPIQYPDGKFYVKLGHFHGTVPRRLTSVEEVKSWFCNGNPTLADDTAQLIRSMFKDVRFKSHYGDYCVVVQTVTNLPYIDTVHDQLAVAIGGNGYAAKSSDEIGRIAASMVLSGWDSDIPRDVFRLQYMPQTGPTVMKSML